MKKTVQILFAALMVLSVYSASAQVRYGKGDVLINAGIGAGYYYASGVPLIASAEFFVNDAISVGPYLGFTHYNYGGYRYNNVNYKYKYNFIDIGGRAAYHFSKHLNLHTDKLDLYGGAMLGFVASSYSGDATVYSDPYGSELRGGVFGGARYYMTPVFSFNGEVGIGLTPLLVGVSFKL